MIFDILLLRVFFTLQTLSPRENIDMESGPGYSMEPNETQQHTQIDQEKGE